MSTTPDTRARRHTGRHPCRHHDLRRPPGGTAWGIQRLALWDTEAHAYDDN